MNEHIKGLRLYLPPFAPDTAGAASVLFPTGGLTVIIDAGGCAGNICGFDEPRWTHSTAAVMSAGLRDMDAIMGRDDRLIAKIEKALRDIDATYIALVSTPVPAVIGTDLRALRRLLERRTGLPVVTIDSDGTHLYDSGESKAYLALVQAFAAAGAGQSKLSNSIGVWGATPLDSDDLQAEQLRQHLHEAGYEHIFLYGRDKGIAPYEQAASLERNLVIAPAGLAAARYLCERFAIPYTIGTPLAASVLNKASAALTKAHRIMILHQQVMANALREEIRQHIAAAGAASTTHDIVCATFFAQDQAITETCDQHFSEEYELQDYVANYAPNVIFGDATYRLALPDFSGLYIDCPHFAVSGSR